MKRARKILSFVMLIVLFISIHANASSIVLTAVNDTFLPLENNTMPTKKSGEWYVPYVVFNNFGIISYMQDNGDSLVMQTENQTITFSLSQGYTYDKNLNTLSQPAYNINDTIYLPVKLMCAQFGLSFSVITGESLIVRICDQNAKLTDSDFVADTNQNTEEIVDNYKNEGKTEIPVVKPEPEPEPNNKPEPVPPEKPITPATIRPEFVYLSFMGEINEFSNDLLDTLQLYSTNATFFIPVNSKLDDDFIRKAIVLGNNIGWVVNDEQDIVNKLEAANQQLFSKTGTMSRLVILADEDVKNIDDIKNAGYTVWQNSIIAQDEKYNATKTSQKILNILDNTTNPCVISLHHQKSTNAALTLILRDFKANNVNSYKITAANTPI